MNVKFYLTKKIGREKTMRRIFENLFKNTCWNFHGTKLKKNRLLI